MERTALSRAVALAELVSEPDFEKNFRQTNLASAQLNHLNSLREGLLGIEQESRRTIELNINNTYNRLKILEYEHAEFTRRKEVGSCYRRLSMEPLGWRDSQGFPKLVVFALHSPIFRLRVMPDKKQSSVEPGLPLPMAESYTDVLNLLAAKKEKRKGIELVCQFEGLIPRDVREKIKEAYKTFGESNIFIIGEPGKFEINQINPLPTKVDPLVVGYDSKADPNSLWLIAAFDTTPVEEAMACHLENSNNQNPTS